MVKGQTRAAKVRETKRAEVIRYLKERGSVQHVFDCIEKLENETIELEPVVVTRLSKAIDARLKLLNKYLPDEKAVEIKNAEGESFKTDSKWTIEIVDAEPTDT